MNLENSIKGLVSILQKYSVEDIDQAYRSLEVQNAINSFTSDPDVRYSANMQKRILKEAKAKKIPPGRKDFIKFLINRCSTELDEKEYPSLHGQLDNLLKKLKAQSPIDASCTSICLEHTSEFRDWYCILHGIKKGDDEESELLCIETQITFDHDQKLLDSHKFNSMLEQLEGLIIEDEEYPQIFYELIHFNLYKLIQKTISNEPLVCLFLSDPRFKSASFTISYYDSPKFQIYPI